MGNPWDHIKASKKLIADNLYDDFVNDTPISFININDKRFKKRKGYKETSPYFRYDKYSHAKTMKEAIYLGASVDDLIFDFSKDYWKLVDEKDAGVEECKEIIIHTPKIKEKEIKKSTNSPITNISCLCCPDDYKLELQNKKLKEDDDYNPEYGTKYGLCYVCDEEIGDGGYDYKDYPSKICKSCYDMPDPVDVKKIRELEKLNDGIMDENKRLKKLVESLMKECDKKVEGPSIKKLKLENEKLKKEIEELKSDKISMASAWEEDLEKNNQLQKNCEKLHKKNKKLEKKIKDDEPMIVYQATEIDDEISNLMKQVDLKEFKNENKKLKEEKDKYEDLFKEKCAEGRRPLCLKQISEYKEENKKLIEENKKLKDNDDVADLLEEIQELKERISKLKKKNKDTATLKKSI